MNSIKRHRIAAGLTQKQLAVKIHRTKGCICLYEKGVRIPPIPVAKKIATAVGCGLEELFTEDG